MKYIYLCPFCLLLVAIFVVVEKNKKYLLADIIKGLASCIFVIVGYLMSQQCTDMTFAHRVLIGLILGMVADILLNLRYVFKKKGQLVFLIGILVFLAGHILYLWALVPRVHKVYIGIMIGILLTNLVMTKILKIVQAKPAFKIFGIFYIAAVMLMTTVACQSAMQHLSMGDSLFALGAILFLISDIVLILNTFTSKTRFSLRITNITLYYIGQLLIAFSLQYF